jgi:hypothetical protein
MYSAIITLTIMVGIMYAAIMDVVAITAEIITATTKKRFKAKQRSRSPAIWTAALIFLL